MSPPRLRLVGSLICLVAAGGLAAEDVLNADTLLDFLRHDRPSARWDPASVVSGDFNGDGRLDMAALGAEGSGLLAAVAVRADGTYMTAQYLPFAVSAATQAAVCTWQAKLIAEPVECSVDGQPLPGCTPSAMASGLALADDDCDAIHMYWDHEKGAMAWWRR